MLMNEGLRNSLKEVGIIGYSEEPKRLMTGTEGTVLTAYFELGSKYFESEDARAKTNVKLRKEGQRKRKELIAALQALGSEYTCTEDVDFDTVKFLDVRYLDIDTDEEKHYNSSTMWSPRAIVLKKIKVFVVWPKED
jgi:hypothetical protein